MGQQKRTLTGNFLMLATLLATGRLVTEDNIVAILFDGRRRAEPLDASNAVNSTVCRLRRLLREEHGIEIPRAINHYGIRLPPEEVEKLRRVLNNMHAENVTGDYRARLKYAAETFRRAQALIEQELNNDVEVV